MSIFLREDTAWSAWTKSLEGFVGDPGAPIAVQSPTILRPLGVRPEVNQLLAWYRKYLVGDSIPFYGSRNPNAYVSGTNRLVGLGYQQYLNELNREAVSRLVNHNDLAAIEQARKRYESANKAFTLFRQDANADWKRKKLADPTLTREAWEDTYGSGGYRPVFNSLQSETQRAYSNYKSLSSPYPQLVRIAQSLARMDYGTGTQIQLPTSEDDLTLGQEGWDSFYKTNIDLGEDWKDFWTKDIDDTREISQNDAQSSYYNNSWSAGGSVSYGFFSVGGGASGSTVENHLRQGTQKVKFSFKKLISGSVVRGSWYDPGLVSSLPYIKWVGWEDYWGPNGTLNLIPVSTIVVRGLKVEISTSQAAYDSYQNWRQTSGSAGFGIGPFSIGGSASSSTSWGSVSDTSSGTTIRIEDKSGQAYVMAVVLQKMDEVVSHSMFSTHVATRDYEQFSQEEAKLVSKVKALAVP